MGGLFSSPEEVKIPERTEYRSPYIEEAQLPIYQYRHRSLYYNVNEDNAGSSHSYAGSLLKDLESLRIEERHISREITTRKVQSPSIVRRNTNILNINRDLHFDRVNVVSFIPVSEDGLEYMRIRRMITNKSNFKIDRIEKIENPFLKKAYNLKREQKREKYPNLEERLLFHGTKHANVDDICKYNFDWRLCKAHKYGAGVSFSPNSTYASNYSDEFSYNKVMIVAQVLIGNSCFGHENMVLPDDGCDTSQKGLDAIVVVKYEDHEFYPAYKINYHLVNPNVGKGRRRYNRHHLLFPDF